MAYIYAILILAAAMFPCQDLSAAPSIDRIIVTPRQVSAGPAIAVLATTPVGVSASLLSQATLFRHSAVGQPFANMERIHEDRTHGAPANERITATPVTATVQSTITPEQTIAALSSSLRAGDKTAVSAYFGGSHVDRDSIMAMDRSRMNALADAFSSGHIVRSTDRFRVYSALLTLSGRSVDIEFTMVRTPEGNWIIASW